jgi:pilus assembly protein CpaB
MNRRILAVLIAVLLAIGGGALVVLYAKNADARAIENQQPEKVWVAQKLVPAGTSLKDAQRTELIAQTSVAAAALPAGALQEITPENNSLLALSDVQPGEFLMTARFGTTPVGTKAIQVPSGMLAVSVQLSDPARVGSFVTPGSHIAIFATVPTPQSAPSSGGTASQSTKTTVVLLSDVLVIGMGDTALAAPSKTADSTQQQSAPSFLVTVAVTPAQASRLIHGISGDVLYAALRGSDVKVDPNAQVDDMSIYQGGAK